MTSRERGVTLKVGMTSRERGVTLRELERVLESGVWF